ncbi:MAG: hypothetical protein QXE80_03290 [Pyrobaculum sp.]
MAVKLGVKINIGNVSREKLAVQLKQVTINFGQVLIRIKDQRLSGAAERILPHLTPANAIVRIVR